MKYSHNLVWKSIFEFCPNYRTVKGSGIYINITTALSSVAVIAFIECGNNGIASLGKDRSYAAFVIQDALRELHEKGFLEYGTQEDYWGSPK